MTDWLGVNKLVAPLRPLVAKISDRTPLRVAAESAIVEHYGPHAADHPPTVNVGILAVQSRGMPATYFVRPSASRVVHETDLRSIPSEPPHLLRNAGIVEARRPETGERLWGDVASLGWYAIRGGDREPPSLLDAIYLIGCHYPDGYHVARWAPRWSGKDLDSELPYEDPDLLVGDDGDPGRGLSLADVAERASHHEFARQAARYLTIFGLLAEVQDGPLRFEIEKDGRTRQVRLKDLSAKGLRKPPEPRPEPQSPLDPLARVLAETPVKGHLQRYRVGSGRARVEWRYVDGYSGRRWCTPRWIVERDHAHSGLANDSLIYRGKK